MDGFGIFEKLKTKDIFCLGNGKHFKNITCPFLRQSGLLANLKGFVDASANVVIDDHIYQSISKKALANTSFNNTVIIIAVTGYREILSQLKADPVLSKIKAIPSIYLEALYEDLLLMSAKKPPKGFRKNSVPKIPKVIHTFWFSGDPMPKLYQDCLRSWKKYAPDYKIHIWDLDTYKPGECVFFEQAISHKNWAFASDYARVDVLRRYGGVYMDLDVEMLRPIDDHLYNDAYMSFESLGRIECGSGMGAQPKNSIIDEICKSYEQRPYLKEDGSWDNSTCPVRYTQVIEKHGLVKNGGFQFVDDITIYPFEVLTGKSFDTGIVYRTDLSYTLHHHSGNWVPDKAHDAMEKRYEEIREFLQTDY